MGLSGGKVDDKSAPAAAPAAVAQVFRKNIPVPVDASAVVGNAKPPTEVPKGEIKMAVIGGGVKVGKVEIISEAVLVNADNDQASMLARKPHRKDRSGNNLDNNDGKRREYVFEYLDREGGYIRDPSDKSKFIKIEKGSLKY